MLVALLTILRSKCGHRFAAAAAFGLLFSVANLPADAAIQSVQLNDPAGDVTQPGNPDIVSIVTDYDDVANKITSITVNFDSPVTPASSQTLDSLFGVILIDLGADADLAAELASFSNSPSSAIEYYVDLFGEFEVDPGPPQQLAVPLIDQAVDLPIEYSNLFMTLKIDFTPANVSTANGFAVGAVVGLFSGPTDQAPKLAAVVPEPASFATWTLAAMSLAFAHRRRRHIL